MRMSALAVRARRAVGWGVRTLFLMAIAVSWAYAEDSSVVVRVEEEWELVVAEPEYEAVAPQVTATFSPSGSNGHYCTFELNHETQPDFVPGGLHLQLWYGTRHISSHRFSNHEVMGVAGEVVRWTQAMSLANGKLTFEVVSGTSETWGEFGGNDQLKAVVASSLSSLNNYSPENSVRQSGVSYAGNRVESLVLKKVKRQLSTGEWVVDDTPRVVHTLDSATSESSND